ncbi:hypothetical protein NIES4071_96420 [Calothrix sp. NIES-4071]|nr:hypothetical protein NIES4071_96420 [Calothrix sp. NIES-4071]BAZ63907.1 hypothetical protein NIES4105_96350 [Calothrix sp. NIES-4105]
MVQLTIQIPDELAIRLEPLQSRLPELLWQLVEENSVPAVVSPETQVELANVPNVYQEVIDFLIRRPTPEEIINFKVSSENQMRLQSLLQKNREAKLSPIELAELDVYQQLEIIMILLKARTYSLILQ